MKTCLKRKNRGKIEDPNDNISKRRKIEGKEKGNEQRISKKAIQMRRYHEKLKLKRGEKYDELKARDAERNRNNRKLANHTR